MEQRMEQVNLLVLTASQERHLNELTENFDRLMDSKYRDGARRHGGDLQDMTPLALIDNAICEVLDQWAYLWTLRSKLCRR